MGWPLPPTALPAYTPFMEPLPVEGVWWLLAIPLVLGVAVVYKTLKLEDLGPLPREAGVLALLVFLFMGALMAVLSLVTWLL